MPTWYSSIGLPADQKADNTQRSRGCWRGPSVISRPHWHCPSCQRRAIQHSASLWTGLTAIGMAWYSMENARHKEEHPWHAHTNTSGRDHVTLIWNRCLFRPRLNEASHPGLARLARSRMPKHGMYDYQDFCAGYPIPDNHPANEDDLNDQLLIRCDGRAWRGPRRARAGSSRNG